MKIHFVCTSNTFRSRLADAYLRSKEIPNLTVSSSGIQANLNPNGIITWYAQRIIENENLEVFEPPIWHQTTPELLNEADKVVFMLENHLEFCKKNFGFNQTNYEIWNIEDITQEDRKDDTRVIKLTDGIYSRIKTKVDEFISQQS